MTAVITIIICIFIRNVDSNLELNSKVKIRRQILDYDKIKHDLSIGDDKKKCLLFQALQLVIRCFETFI